MRQEDCSKLLERLTQVLRQKGLGQMTYYVQNTRELDVNIYRQETDRLVMSQVCLISVEAEFEGFRAYGFLERLDEALFPQLAEDMIQVARYNRQPFVPVELGEGQGEVLPGEEAPFPETGELLERLRQADRMGYAVDCRVETVNHCSYFQTDTQILLMDDRGHQIADHTGCCQAEMSVIAREGEKVQTTYLAQVASQAEELDLGALCRETARQTVSMLDADTLESGNYPVVLQNRVFAQMLSSYLPIFCGDAHHKGTSLLKGREGERIGVELLSLREDPALPGGAHCRRVDDEGVPTQAKYLIRNGVLEQVLHNRDTAQKLGTQSTGNGFRTSCKSPVTVGVTNLVVEPGAGDVEELSKDQELAVLITQVDGLHAGIHTDSGDFSLLSQGYLLKHGRAVGPLHQITVAGNLYEVFRSILAVGADSASTGLGMSHVLSPSVLVRQLTVSGK